MKAPKKLLIAVDLEGIHGVAGEPNLTLTDSKDYRVAVENAIKEVNTAASALFECGAELVAVWDNHGGGKNLDFSRIDQRVVRIDTTGNKFRFDFVDDFGFDGVLLFGYHAKEGEFGGVLAHKYSSKTLQYVKVGGKAVGEITLDTQICADHGVPVIFCAADDICLKEMKAVNPDAVCVVTKYGKSRNEAEFIDERIVLEGIKNGVKQSISEISLENTERFSENSHIEIRYTRAERAAEVYKRVTKNDLAKVWWGEDSHVLHFTATSAKMVIKFL